MIGFGALARGGAAVGVLAVTLGVSLHFAPATAETPARVAPAPLADEPAQPGQETIVLSGGCFWGVQGVFQHVRGVTSAVSGYTGGSAATAQYETVSGGDTGHAESVKITFDPSRVSLGHLLQIFVSVVADPTELDYQGPDHGTQYRSEIWVSTPAQRHVAEAYLAQLGAAHSFPAQIVTRVDTLGGFYPAEGYHQDFLTRHPDQPYIAAMDMPKLDALKALFPQDWREAPALVTASAAD